MQDSRPQPFAEFEAFIQKLQAGRDRRTPSERGRKRGGAHAYFADNTPTSPQAAVDAMTAQFEKLTSQAAVGLVQAGTGDPGRLRAAV